MHVCVALGSAGGRSTVHATVCARAAAPAPGATHVVPRLLVAVEAEEADHGGAELHGSTLGL